MLDVAAEATPENTPEYVHRPGDHLESCWPRLLSNVSLINTWIL